MLRSENCIDIEFDIDIDIASSLLLLNDSNPSGMVKQPDLLTVFQDSRVHALQGEAAGRCGCAELANAPFARLPIPDQRLSLLQCRKKLFFTIVGSSVIGQI